MRTQFADEAAPDDTEDTAEASQTEDSDESDNDDGIDDDRMTVGMVAGFVSFFVVAVAACGAWHCVCNKLCHPKVKVAPADFRSISY